MTIMIVTKKKEKHLGSVLIAYAFFSLIPRSANDVHVILSY